MHESRQLPRAELGPGMRHALSVSRSSPHLPSLPEAQSEDRHVKSQGIAACLDITCSHTSVFLGCYPAASGPGMQEGGKAKVKIPGGFWPTTRHTVRAGVSGEHVILQPFFGVSHESVALPVKSIGHGGKRDSVNLILTQWLSTHILECSPGCILKSQHRGHTRDP